MQRSKSKDQELKNSFQERISSEKTTSTNNNQLKDNNDENNKENVIKKNSMREEVIEEPFVEKIYPMLGSSNANGSSGGGANKVDEMPLNVSKPINNYNKINIK